MKYYKINHEINSTYMACKDDGTIISRLMINNQDGHYIVVPPKLQKVFDTELGPILANPKTTMPTGLVINEITKNEFLVAIGV